MCAAQRLVSVFREFDAKDSGIISRKELTVVLSTLSPSTWTETQVDRLLSAVDKHGDGCIRYEDFATWVMERPPPSIELATEEELLRSIQLASSQGPSALSSVFELSQPIEEATSEQELLFRTLSTDAPTNPPTRRPSLCSAPEEEEDTHLTGTLMLEAAEADLMTSIHRASSQGLSAFTSPLMNIAAPAASEKVTVLNDALDDDPPTRRPSFDEACS